MESLFLFFLINFLVTYFFVILIEFIILLLFLLQYRLKFKVFTHILLINLITFPFIHVYTFFFIYRIYNIFTFYYIITAGVFTICIEYILLIDKFEKSGVWTSLNKLKRRTFVGIIVANIISYIFGPYLSRFFLISVV